MVAAGNGPSIANQRMENNSRALMTKYVQIKVYEVNVIENKTDWLHAFA